jgi:hypothetical protein
MGYVHKSLLCCTIVAAGATTPVSAETIFEGRMTITAVNAFCTQGPGVGQSGTATFHPNSVSGGTQNQNASGLNIFFDTGAQSWKLEGAAFTTAFQQTTGAGVGWTYYTAQKPSFVRIISQSPALIATTTPTISLYGQIKNYWGFPGHESCVATFRMVGLLTTR